MAAAEAGDDVEMTQDARRASRTQIWFRPPAEDGHNGAVSTKESVMGELQGIVRFTFHPGKVDEFKRLSAECLEVVRAEDDGTLQYDTYFNADESEAIVLERFRDSDALILHSENMALFMESIMATASVSGELLGDLSDELRANMESSPVGLFTLYQSL
jgi:quinol monooxygenase YgiN